MVMIGNVLKFRKKNVLLSPIGQYLVSCGRIRRSDEKLLIKTKPVILFRENISQNIVCGILVYDKLGFFI